MFNLNTYLEYHNVAVLCRMLLSSQPARNINSLPAPHVTHFDVSNVFTVLHPAAWWSPATVPSISAVFEATDVHDDQNVQFETLMFMRQLSFMLRSCRGRSSNDNSIQSQWGSDNNKLMCTLIPIIRSFNLKIWCLTGCLHQFCLMYLSSYLMFTSVLLSHSICHLTGCWHQFLYHKVSVSLLDVDTNFSITRYLLSHWLFT